ncbi:MAG: HaeIII family restriction endonuclease [Spirosomataceae bacterium]|jgi:plasmid maintenance system killer protein
MPNASQTKNGKAFEYAILIEFFGILKGKALVKIIENQSFEVAQKSFHSQTKKERDFFCKYANSAINYIIELEPRLINQINSDDILTLEIVTDREGQAGDVRDILAIRINQEWEIGISAKNNHKAVKHSRLSKEIDFGEKWLELPCSAKYFDEINPIFEKLKTLRTESNNKMLWSSLEDYHTSVYIPILNSFKKELLLLDTQNPGVVAKKLVEYLVGKKDFYKIIKSNKNVEIQAYNLHGTLNRAFKQIKPKSKIQKLKLPSKIIDISFQEGSKTTLNVTLNEGWQISFRIHNASSRIEPSLKFDINLISTPNSLFVNKLLIE